MAVFARFLRLIGAGAGAAPDPIVMGSAEQPLHELNETENGYQREHGARHARDETGRAAALIVRDRLELYGYRLGHSAPASSSVCCPVSSR